MKTEIDKPQHQPFALNEQELRRILALMTQQLNHVVTQSVETQFTLRFLNGSVGSPTTLDEILSQENGGSILIVGLEIAVSDGPYLKQVHDPVNPYVSLEFRRLATTQPVAPISYKILGNDRDWVFVTSSLLDERIARIRRVSFLPAILEFSDTSYRLLFLGLALSLALLITLLLISTGLVPSSSSSSGSISSAAILTAVGQVESAWRSGNVSDPVEAILLLHRLEAQVSQSQPVVLPANVILPLSSFLLMFCLYGLSFRYFFPSCNFLWGDYVKEFDRKSGQGLFVFQGVIVATLVAVLGGLILTALTSGRT